MNNNEIKLIASLLSAAISDAEPSALRDICVRVKNDLYGAITVQVAQQATVDDPVVIPTCEQNARWAIDGAIQHGREGINKPTSEHWLMTYWNMGKVLCSTNLDAWGNFTQATVEPLTDAQSTAIRNAILKYSSMEPEAGESWESWYPASFELMSNEIGELLATPPTSKATDGWNPNQGDNFGSAEHWKEKAQDWASYAEKLRKEIGGMVSVGELAKVNEALENWISGVYVRHVKPVQLSVVPEATAYAESMRYAVTKQWISGWNDCRDYRLATSKADTGSIRNAEPVSYQMRGLANFDDHIWDEWETCSYLRYCDIQKLGNQTGNQWIYEARALCLASTSTLGEEKAVTPEGFKIVPIEPTRSMFEAARNYYFSLHKNHAAWPCGEAMGIYAVMLAAVPSTIKAEPTGEQL